MFDQSELKSHPEVDNAPLPESGTELERVKGGGPLQVKDREAGTQKQEVAAKARGPCFQIHYFHSHLSSGPTSVIDWQTLEGECLGGQSLPIMLCYSSASVR